MAVLDVLFLLVVLTGGLSLAAYSAARSQEDDEQQEGERGEPMTRAQALAIRQRTDVRTSSPPTSPSTRLDMQIAPKTRPVEALVQEPGRSGGVLAGVSQRMNLRSQRKTAAEQEQLLRQQALTVEAQGELEQQMQDVYTQRALHQSRLDEALTAQDTQLVQREEEHLAAMRRLEAQRRALHHEQQLDHDEFQVTELELKADVERARAKLELARAETEGARVRVASAHTEGSSGECRCGLMYGVQTQPEVLHVAEPVGLALEDLDLVVQAFQRPGRYQVPEVGDEAGAVALNGLR